MSNPKPGSLLPYCVAAALRNPDGGLLEHVRSGLVESLRLTPKTPAVDTPHLSLHGVKRKRKNLATTSPPPPLKAPESPQTQKSR